MAISIVIYRIRDGIVKIISLSIKTAKIHLVLYGT